MGPVQKTQRECAQSLGGGVVVCVSRAATRAADRPLLFPSQCPLPQCPRPMAGNGEATRRPGGWSTHSAIGGAWWGGPHKSIWPKRERRRWNRVAWDSWTWVCAPAGPHGPSAVARAGLPAKPGSLGRLRHHLKQPSSLGTGCTLRPGLARLRLLAPSRGPLRRARASSRARDPKTRGPAPRRGNRPGHAVRERAKRPNETRCARSPARTRTPRPWSGRWAGRPDPTPRPQQRPHVKKTQNSIALVSPPTRVTFPNERPYGIPISRTGGLQR